MLPEKGKAMDEEEVVGPGRLIQLGDACIDTRPIHVDQINITIVGNDDLAQLPDRIREKICEAIRRRPLLPIK